MSRQPESRNAGAEDAQPEDFDRLVGDLLENPERLLKADLTPEQILEIQRRVNPYAGIAGPPPAAGGRKKIAACSYTNLREDYLRRLTMTSLVAYLFQMHHEWEVPGPARRWVPAGAPAGGPAPQPFAADDLVKHLEAALAVAREAQAAGAGAGQWRRDALAQDAGLAEKAAPAEKARVTAAYAEAAALEAKAAGLLYAATYTAHRVGADASWRLRSTAEAGMKFAEVKAVLERYPLPPPPGQVEMPAAAAKEIINGFLLHYLAFDPSVHVRSAHDAEAIAKSLETVTIAGAPVVVDAAEPGHLPLETVRAAAPAAAPEHRAAVRTIMASQSAHGAVVALLRDEDLLEAALQAVESPDAFRAYLMPVAAGAPARPAADRVPPQDTFHRWSYFSEVNHEEIRTITEALYPERPDLDWAIALWATFEGTPKEVDEAFDKFCQRYQKEVSSSIKALDLGAWSLLADFKENRKKIQFFNENTEVLKRILDRHSEDKRIGAELMRNRVRQTKAKNIAEEGADAPGLKRYKQDLVKQGQDLGGKGVERVISPEAMRRLEKAGGSIKAAQELELLEQTEKRIAELTELEALRKAAGQRLGDEDQRELDRARGALAGIREMVNVPDDAIQVDVFTSSPATGEFKKEHFYSQAEAPEHVAAARREFEAKRGKSGHPAAIASEAAAVAAEADDALPAYAPYAVDHMLRDEGRSEADRHVEARLDAARARPPQPSP